MARLSPQGAVTWPASPQGHAPHLPANLYDGTCGIALFLAALAKATGDSTLHDLAEGALRPLRRKLMEVASREKAARPSFPLGGFFGLGSWIYTLLRAALWLDQPEMLDEAVSIACALTDPTAIAAAPEIDLSHGIAGLLLALLALEEAIEPAISDQAKLLALARVCGRRLLGRARSDDSKRNAVESDNAEARLSGFAHGASGIAHALLTLAERDPGQGWRRAALESLAFERSLYVARHATWRDPRCGGLLEQSAWCHGAPGMILARLRLDPAPDQVREELERYIEHTLALPAPPSDHLCCGLFGRIDILNEAGQALDRPYLGQAARGLALGRLDHLAGDRALSPESTSARYRFAPSLLPEQSSQGWIDPTLMTGLAGVGYALLRLTQPGLPCLLRLA